MCEYEQEVHSNRNDKNEYHLSPILMKSINNIVENEGYMTYKIHARDISTEGGNYMSLLKEVDIKGKTIDNNKETNLFIKQCLRDSDTNILPPKELFMKEIFVYTELAELFNELQNEFNVPDEEKYNFVKCYNAYYEDLLILDNMIKKGFKIYNRFEVIPLNAIILSVKLLAKYHAFSVVLKQYKPDFYRNKIQTMEHLLIFNDKAKNFVTFLCNNSLSYLEGDKKINMEKKLPGLLNKYYYYLHNNENKVKCLCHGDYRMNNILFKEKNGEISAVIPIDYQTIFYGSPITDLLYAIFISTDRSFRQNSMEDLKKIYYESFTGFLRYFKIDAESVYPLKEYEKDFKNQLEVGLVVTLCILPFVMVSEDDVPEINSELKTIKLNDNFKSRIEEVIDEFMEWGYL